MWKPPAFLKEFTDRRGVNEFQALLDLAPYSKAERDTFDNDAVLRAIRLRPDLAQTKFDFTHVLGLVYPLFMAVSIGASPEVVTLLAVPDEALEGTDEYSRTPLHQAVEYRASVAVVQLVLNRRPLLSRSKDYIGRTPLHCACAYNSSMEVANLLIQSNPQALFEKDNRRRLPLHIACSSEDSCVQVARLFLEKHPQAMYETDGRGATALEKAEKGRASLEVANSFQAVNSMLQKKTLNEREARTLIARFESIGWKDGTWLLLNHHPSIVQTLQIGNTLQVMPQLLSMAGHRYNLTTLFSIVKNSPAIWGR